MKRFVWVAGIGAAALAAPLAHAQQTEVLQGNITSDVSLSRDVTYVLSGTVFIREPAVMRIEPGTTIVGESATNGTLVIDKGAQLIAKGTPDAPIVFTSDQPVGQRARSDWGGLILNGRAPLNVPGGEAEGEGDTGTYGGTDPLDDSGEFGYLRVEFAGTEFSPDNELNGIAFQGVGAGTFVDYVQVHFNKDDGIEFFGGTVSVKHALCTAIGDDSFDWTEGWTGRGQFWIGQQKGDDADQGFEADNNAENNDLLPRSFPRIFNFTLIGAPGTQDGTESDIGMLLREGTAGIMKNGIVTGFKEIGIEIDHRATFTQAAAGELVLESMIVHGNGQNFSTDGSESPAPPFTTLQYMTTIAQNISTANPELLDHLQLIGPDFRPSPTSPAATGAVPVAALPDDGDGFWEPAPFIGGMGPTDDWTAGWTTDAQN
jgi:hypothetical protein